MQVLQNSFNSDSSSAHKHLTFASRCWRGLAELSALGFIFYLWMLSQSALAEANSADQLESPVESKRYSSLWLTPLETKASENESSNQKQRNFSALQVSTDVDIQVTGPISRVLVKQTFYNPSQSWVEGEYSYPLPESAAVDHLRMRVGARMIEGQVQEKQEAAKTYAMARRDGKRASLLSHQRSHQFRTQVANIAPQERVIIEFEYQHWLDFRDGQYSFRFPMVSSPVYTPSVQEGSLASLENDFVYPEEHFRAQGEVPGNPVSITLNLDAGLPVSPPVSESHKVSIAKVDSSRYEVELKGLAALSNRDFLLSWRPESNSQPTVTLLQETYENEHYGLLMIMPPQEELVSEGFSSRELVFILDVSGSMQGASIKQAKASLEQALSHLKEGDLFNLIWFNNRASSLFPASQQASARNIAVALHQIKRLRAEGGTNMLPALNKALQIEPEGEVSSNLRQVVFITDGAVSNETELFSMIHQTLGHSRLFTVGIGSAPNSSFMRKAARAGRGSFTYVSRPEGLEEKISALFRQLESPALTDVSIDFQGYELELFPRPLPDVYLGEPLYAVFKGSEFPEYALLIGKIDGREVYMRHDLQEHSKELRDGGEPASTQSGIAGEWAKRKIEYLLEEYKDSDDEGRLRAKQSIVDLALAHHQVSKFTSLVAVDITSSRNDAELVKHKLPSNLPHGWALGGQKAKSLQLAQTSSGLWFYVYSGLAAFMLACIFLSVFKRCIKQGEGASLC